MLRHFRLTPSAFAEMGAADQSFMLGYELFRARQIAEWRNSLIDAEDHRFTPDVATALFIEGL